jgi:chromosome partitioning protein
MDGGARRAGYRVLDRVCLGVGQEVKKLAKADEAVIIDTPLKADSDLRPTLKVADLILVPVASSHLDLWAVKVLLYLAERENKPAMIVMTGARPNTRLVADVASKASEMAVEVAMTPLANRVAYAETLGRGKAAEEGPKGPAHAEVEGLVAEIDTRLQRV